MVFLTVSVGTTRELSAFKYESVKEDPRSKTRATYSMQVCRVRWGALGSGERVLTLMTRTLSLPYACVERTTCVIVVVDLIYPVGCYRWYGFRRGLAFSVSHFCATMTSGVQFHLRPFGNHASMGRGGNGTAREMGWTGVPSMYMQWQIYVM